jgi:hypothetical protein
MMTPRPSTRSRLQDDDDDDEEDDDDDDDFEDQSYDDETGVRSAGPRPRGAGTRRQKSGRRFRCRSSRTRAGLAHPEQAIVCT